MGQLLTTQTSDTTSSAETWTGGTGTMFVRGTFMGKEKVTMIVTKYSQDDEASDDGELVLRGKGQKNFTLGACDIKLKLEGSAAGTSVDAGIEAI